MSEKKAKNCQQCVIAQQATSQSFGTHSNFPVNHPKCGSCCWARALTGRGQLVDCVEYCDIKQK